MQPVPEDTELLKPSSSCSNSSILGFEAEFGLDLCQYFEDVPLNMEEFNEQYTYNSMLDTLVALPANNNNDDILRSHSFHQDISIDDSEAVNDASNEVSVGTERSSLQLHLNTASEIQEEISTPAIIQMLLEGTENVTDQVTITSFNYFPFVVYFSKFEEITNRRNGWIGRQVLPVMHNDAWVADHVPATIENDEMETATGSNQVQKRDIQKRVASDSSEDLRRLRNNEASRKSRQNRRERMTGQLSMLTQLEKENQQLIVKVKELEQLRDEMMKYLKKDSPWEIEKQKQKQKQKQKKKQTKRTNRVLQVKIAVPHLTLVFVIHPMVFIQLGI